MELTGGVDASVGLWPAREPSRYAIGLHGQQKEHPRVQPRHDEQGDLRLRADLGFAVPSGDIVNESL